MKPEDVWDVKKQAAESSSVMLDDAHLDAPTWHYLLAWLLLIFITNFTLIFLAYFFETFLGASEAIATFIYYAAFGPGILFATYLTYGKLFQRTNIRKVFPFFFLALIGGFGNIAGDDGVVLVQDGYSTDSLRIIFLISFSLFIIFIYKFPKNMNPVRWVARIK